MSVTIHCEECGKGMSEYEVFCPDCNDKLRPTPHGHGPECDKEKAAIGALQAASAAVCKEYDRLHRDKTTLDGAHLADAIEVLAKLSGCASDRAACTTCVEVRGPTYDRVWAAHHGPL